MFALLITFFMLLRFCRDDSKTTVFSPCEANFIAILIFLFILMFSVIYYFNITISFYAICCLCQSYPFTLQLQLLLLLLPRKDLFSLTRAKKSDLRRLSFQDCCIINILAFSLLFFQTSIVVDSQFKEFMKGFCRNKLFLLKC